MDRKPRAVPPPRVSDVWFAQIAARLGRIEIMVARLEWQIWVIVCSCASLLVFEIVKALSGAPS